MTLWLILGIVLLHLFSLGWLALVIKDTNTYLETQIWALGEEHRGRMKSTGIVWLKLMYFMLIVLFIPLSFLAWFVLF